MAPNVQHTVRSTERAATLFKDFWQYLAAAWNVAIGLAILDSMA
jgi:hypothetical protein